MTNKLRILWAILLPALLCKAPAVSAQYMSNLYDYDSSAETGFEIFLRPDNSYMLMGGAGKYTSGIFSMGISSDINGDTITSKRDLFIDGYNVYFNYPITIRKAGTGYAAGITVQGYSPRISMAGLLRLDSIGDTLFTRIYTDTTKFRETIEYVTATHDDGYLLSGHQADTAFNSPEMAMLIRTDSMGNMLWKHIYRKLPTLTQYLNSAVELSDGRILASSYLEHFVWVDSPITYYAKDDPWFLILDSAGNLLKDTVWQKGFITGTDATTDINGGYSLLGELDSLLDKSEPSYFFNFPCYLAHTDTNFRVQWKITFKSSKTEGSERPYTIKQFSDGSYLIVGFMDYPMGTSVTAGWAAKVSKNGKLLWDHTYINDIRYQSYLSDAVIKPDGHIAMVGWATNGSEPKWHSQDVWLVEVDSNGCIDSGGCDNGLSVPLQQQVSQSFSLYPNPTNGSFTINTSQPATLFIYNIQGMEIGHYTIAAGNNTLNLPPGSPAGIYIIKTISQDKTTHVARLIYEP